jgi:hypothetical protein
MVAGEPTRPVGVIGDLITGQVPPLDLTAYRVDRF